MLKEGNSAQTNIRLKDQDGKLVNLNGFKGKKLVKYFTPYLNLKFNYKGNDISFLII